MHAEPHEVGNKKVALLIAVLAFCLALSGTAANNAQTVSIQANVEASNLWAFFQARTMRQTVVTTAQELATNVFDEADSPRAVEQVARWKAMAARWESDPQNNDGRRELTLRAKAAEAKRERATAAHHLFEYGNAAFELGIILASASIVVSMPVLAFVAGGLGVIGAAVGLLGTFAPELVHL